MKIAIHASHLNIPGWDGTKVYMYELIKRMVQIDKTNQFFLYFHDFPGRTDLISEIKGNNVKLVGSKWPFMWTQTRFPFELFRDKPDVLWMPLMEVPLIRPRNMKVVMTIHDLGYMKYLKAHGLRDRLLLKYMTPYAAKACDKIITISEYSRRDIIKNFAVSKEKMTVIYEGYDKIFRPFEQKDEGFKSQVLQKYKLNNPYILFIGTFQPRKNIIRLIKAFDLLKSKYKIPHQLVLVGGNAWQAEEIRFKIQDSRFKNDIIRLEKIKREEMPALLWGSEFFTLPSLFEGFGLPVIEAQACGTPVVTSNITSLPEVGGEEAAVYVDPYSVESIAQGLIKVIKDKDLQRNLTQKGFENIRRFSWDREAKETLGIITNV